MKLNTYDITIISLNFLAFLLQIWMPEGTTSATAFIIFSMILCVIIYETYSSYGRIKSLIFSTSKLVFYILAVIVLIAKGGGEYVFSTVNLIMIFLSLGGLILRNHIRHWKLHSKTSFLLWIQNLALLPGGIAYCLAVIQHSQDYGIYSLIFRNTNLVVYILTCQYIYSNQEPKAAYIFPGFGLLLTISYILCIILFSY